MASRSVSFQRLPVVSNKRVARRRGHASRLSEEFGRFPRRAMVQESGGRVREISVNQAHRRPARTSPCASGRPDSVGLLRPRSPALSSSRIGPPLSSRLQITVRRSASIRLPKLEIGERLGTFPFGPFLDEGCECPERLGGCGPPLDDGRKGSHRLGGHRGELRKGQTVTATLAWE